MKSLAVFKCKLLTIKFKEYKNAGYCLSMRIAQNYVIN